MHTMISRFMIKVFGVSSRKIHVLNSTNNKFFFNKIQRMTYSSIRTYRYNRSNIDIYNVKKYIPDFLDTLISASCVAAFSVSVVAFSTWNSKGYNGKSYYSTAANSLHQKYKYLSEEFDIGILRGNVNMQGQYYNKQLRHDNVSVLGPVTSYKQIDQSKIIKKCCNRTFISSDDISYLLEEIEDVDIANERVWHTPNYDKIEINTTRSIKIFYDLVEAGMQHIAVTSVAVLSMIVCARFGAMPTEVCTLYRWLSGIYIAQVFATYFFTASNYASIFDSISSQMWSCYARSIGLVYRIKGDQSAMWRPVLYFGLDENKEYKDLKSSYGTLSSTISLGDRAYARSVRNMEKVTNNMNEGLQYLGIGTILMIMTTVISRSKTIPVSDILKFIAPLFISKTIHLSFMQLLMSYNIKDDIEHAIYKLDNSNNGINALLKRKGTKNNRTWDAMFHSVKVVAYSRISANKIFVFCTGNGDSVIATGKWSNDIGNTDNSIARTYSNTILVNKNTDTANNKDVASSSDFGCEK